MSETNTPADATATDRLPLLADTGDPSRLVDHEDVTTEVVDVHVDDEDAFERHREWRGIAIAGITRDDGAVLLVKNTDPDVCHDWVLPHGVVQDADAEWAETATDWVDGLTGLAVDLEEVVHVRRNDVTYDPEDGDTRRTTTYHVIFTGRPRAGETIHKDVRYDCNDVWTADWHDAVPESARETEASDIERILGCGP